MQTHPKLLATLRGFPAAVWVLYLGIFLNKFGAFVIPFLTIYLTRHGFSKKQAAAALIAFGLGQILASLAGGEMADRIGRRKTIIVSMISVAFAMLALSQARSFESIWVLTLVVGFTGELYRPASSALLADLVPENQRVVAFSGYRMALNAGWAFGPAMAGFLAQHSYLWLFLGDAISSLAFGIIAFYALPRRGRVNRIKVATPKVFGMALRNVSFRQMVFASFLVTLVFMQMSSSLGLHVIGNGFSSFTYGVLLSLNGVLVVCFELLVSNWSQRFDPRKAIALGFFLITAGFVICGFGNTLAALFLGMTVLTLGEMCAFPVFSAYLANLAPFEVRGRYMGLSGLVHSFAVMGGPAMGVLLYGYHGQLLWILCGAVGMGSVYLAYFTPARETKAAIPMEVGTSRSG